MDRNERCISFVKELLTGADEGDFDNIETIPEKYTYEHLYSLCMLANVLDNGKKLYEQLYTIATTYGKNSIQKKVKNGEKIKAAFLAISAAEWPAGELYHMLEKDSRVECYVAVVPLTDRDPDDSRETYRQTYQYFRQNGYNVKGTYKEETDAVASWDDLGGVPDIVIHLTSWYAALPAAFQVVSLPLTCISCYIPYGIYVSDSPDGSYAPDFVYNKGFSNMMWKIYADSEKNVEGYREYGLLHGKNVAFSGYTKMDTFYYVKERNEAEIKEIWKIPEGKKADEMKKVIIAPHHSFLGFCGIKYATFARNAYFLLYLAKKYQDKVSFIYKPHPNLRVRAVEAGVFESYEEYDAYVEEWNTLPNAKVVQETSYLDVFATSDGMIMDSASFLAEYMYVNKPLLFLRRNGQAFNKLGKVLLDGYYSEQGENYLGIEKFLQDVILSGNDDKKDVRERIWEKELDYMKINKCSASEFIYQDICTLLA